ncbi:hypothetical protein MMC18_006666 [Xylographa bjoerkii]|nr:hypothetical protein [Xylographa bjoerkii]
MSVSGGLASAFLSDGGREIIIVSVVFTLVATVAVGLRFLARWKTKVSLGTNDWTIVAGLVLQYGLMVDCIFCGTSWSTAGHIGNPALSFTESQLHAFFQCFFAYELLYSVAILFIKLSILLFYRRVFPVRGMNIATWIVGIFCSFWYIACVLLTIFECHPISAYFDQWMPGVYENQCINSVAITVAQGFSNLFTDIIILCLPMPLVLGLHMPIRQKITVAGIFFLGALVCIASILRLVSFKYMTLLNVPEEIWHPVFWSTGEVSLGIVSACLPTLRPLLPKNIWQSLVSGASLSRSRRTSYPSGAPSSGSGGRPPTIGHGRRTQHGSTLSTVSLTDEHTAVESSERAASDKPSMDSKRKDYWKEDVVEYPMTAISVTKDDSLV